MNKKLSCWCLSVVGLCFLLGPSRTFGTVMSLEDIQFWVGSGNNQAALVIDWNDGRDPLAWGYRWDGSATGEDLARAVAVADDRLFAKITAFSFGNAATGFGYDRDEDGFSLDDGTVFTNGIAEVPASDDALPTDADDSYQEGHNLGFWGYYISDVSPFAGGSWGFASTGFTDRILTNGTWDGWSFAPGFSDSSPSQPVAAVPEPETILLCAMALLTIASWQRRARLRLLLGRISNLQSTGLALMMLFGLLNVASASPFATQVIEYIPGAGGAPSFNNPNTVLGEPTRFTNPGSAFGGAVTSFNAPFGTSELLSLGEGGSITVRFDQQVFDHPADIGFGIDFLVFGNTFLGLGPGNVATGAFSEPGDVEVSQDGIAWFSVAGKADTLFPTLGYSDVSEPFPSAAGNVLSDFTKPVDPSLSLTGLTISQIVAAYNGSGGGSGIDFANTGLPWIQFVRVTNPVGSGYSTEVDGFAISIPEPAAWILLAIGLLSVWIRCKLAWAAPLRP